MLGISSIFRRHRRPITLGAAVLALALAAVLFPRVWRKENSRLTTPRLGLETLASKSLYFNGPARPWLLAQRPDLLTAEDRNGQSDRSRTFAQAVADAKLFRQLDRRYRFDTLLLVGDPSQDRTLLDHLVDTKDFVLTYADHTSIVFKRDARRAWSLADFDEVRSRIGNVSSRETASFLALTATKLTAVRREAEARTLLDQALALDSNSAEVWSGFANFHLSRAEWPDALRDAERALGIDAKHLGALSTKTQVLYATNHFNEAYVLSQRLVGRLSDDPNVLFKHAQIAHQAHAYSTEIATLEKLIALAEAQQRSTTGYRLYLAQACTAAGKGKAAIDQFTRVLKDPELPEDQRKFASESLARIQSRTGL
jgi:tetratricopeptide (TPR) repeat protein